MIEDAIRSLFWAIAKLFLSIGDWIYDIINMVINIDISNSKVIIYTWSFMLIFLSFACFFRIAFVILQKTADDNESLDTSKLMKKLGSVFLVVALSTTFFNFSLVAPGYIVKTYNNVITYDERMTSSTAVISATAKTPVTSSLGEMSSTDEVINIKTIDEKLNEEENGEYIYFLGYAELLLCVVGAIIVAVLQINLIVDTVLRLFLNIFRFVIGFIPISSLVEDHSTCGDWVRDMISDAMMMMFVPISLNMVYGLMSTSAFTLLNGIVRIIIFAIALMAISKTGDMVAKYIGASNFSKGGRAGGIFGIGTMMAIRGAGSVLRGAGKYLPKAAGGIANGISNIAKNGAEKATEAAKDAKDYSLRQAALGASIGDVATGGKNKNDYFVNNSSQGTFQSNSTNHNLEESVLDQSPTSNINESNNEASKVSMTDTVKSSSGENLSKNYTSSGMGEAVKGNGKEKQSPLSKTSHSPVSTGGTAFVDNPTSGHLYKSSNSIYKQSIVDKHKNKQSIVDRNTKSMEGLKSQQKPLASKKTNFNNFKGRNYNINELEKQLLKNE